MTLKQYRKIKLATIIVITIIFIESIHAKNFFIPIIVLTISSLLLIYLRKQVKEIIADERDIEAGGRSALLSIQIYSWIAVVYMLLLYSLRDRNPSYEPVAITLAFSTCILTLLYSLIYKYYNKIKMTGKKASYLIITIIIILFASLFTLRVFSGEDSWLCENGKWVEHGHPSFAPPATECK